LAEILLSRGHTNRSTAAFSLDIGYQAKYAAVERLVIICYLAGWNYGEAGNRNVEKSQMQLKHAQRCLMAATSTIPLYVSS
jgi:hypothetical protein